MKNQLIGFPRVFSFTMRMTTGAASWKRTTAAFAVILFLIPCLILTITTAVGKNGETSGFGGSVTTLYTVDETESPVDYSLLTVTDPLAAGVSVVLCGSYDEARALLNGNSGSMLLYVTESDGMYRADLLTGEDTGVTDDDRDYITDLFAMRFNEVLVLKSGLTAEDMMKLVMPVTVTSLGQPEQTEDLMDDTGDLEQESIRELLGFLLPYVTVMFLYFFVLFYGQSAAQLIVMEKTSKLMDTILVSVRPAAMIFGKIASAICCAVIQLAVWLLSLLAGAAAGFAISGVIDPVNALKWSDAAELLSMFDGMFTLPGVILAVFLMLSGCILYCSLASIGGALAGKQEDLQSTNMLFTMALVISFMAVVFGGDLFETGQMASAMWMHFVPFTAVLITPAHVLLGNVSPLIGCVSLALTLLFSAAILLVSGKLYKLMSFYKGNPPKPTQIISLLKTK